MHLEENTLPDVSMTSTCLDSDQDSNECVALWTDSTAVPITSTTNKKNEKSFDDSIYNPEIKVFCFFLKTLKLLKEVFFLI